MQKDRSTASRTMRSATSQFHPVQSFARKLILLLIFRRATQWVTVWFFLWGVVVLAARISGVLGSPWLVFGLLGFAPLAALAAVREWGRRPPLVNVRAAYDGLNECGGVIMAEEVSDMAVWQKLLPPVAPPRLRWRSGRALFFLGLSAAFVAATLLLPDRLTTRAGTEPLEIGQLVGELRAEIDTLEEEKILEEKKVDDLQKQLTQLQEKSSGVDPHRTWEALDHIKEANRDLARQAAEEALAKLTSLTRAQTLAGALQSGAESGLSEETATRAAQDLAAMLKAARLEEGLLKGEIPPELLSDLNGLRKDMEKLLSAIKFNKDTLGKTAGKLAKLKLIDAELLGKCDRAGHCFNPDALVAFLRECQGECDSFAELAAAYCRGGVSRGRGDAPMTWTDGSREEDSGFKEETLPPASRLSDSQFVGVSRAAPDLSGEDVAVGSGALAGGRGAGGAAHAQTILPRHKQTVNRFFKREE
jgi:hypothetical protein